ncbi:hypothetical protein M231_05701 [Tremella mesenterica]|uniref:Uncharacterized protein n=1 Tax=Tremella mesenterica TaxID=5217 RepID=A0A4Q1BHG8_TREME|nr:hypothetical protein M231_05701 [Tremella mesenterica]
MAEFDHHTPEASRTLEPKEIDKLHSAPWTYGAPTELVRTNTSANPTTIWLCAAVEVVNTNGDYHLNLSMKHDIMGPLSTEQETALTKYLTSGVDLDKAMADTGSKISTSLKSFNPVELDRFQTNKEAVGRQNK